MTLEQYWSALVKRWGLIVLCLLIVGLGAYIGSKLMTPLYQSTALVQVNILSSNNQTDINTSEQFSQIEAQLAISDPVLREVASHYPGLTAGRIAKEVTVTPRPNAPLIEIDVLDPSPARAAALANDMARTMIKQQIHSTQQDNAQSQQQIQLDLQQTQKQIATVSGQIARLQAEKGNDTQISVLQAQLNTLQQQYSQWQLLLAQIELTEAQSGNLLRIVQPAQPASAPTQPNVQVNTAAGLLIGLINGVSLAILLELLDTRIRTEEALTQFVDWSVLATVWRPDSFKKDKHKHEALVDPPQHSANVESYRILRTNIGFSVLDKPLRSIMVTSAVPHEGKSTIAANLAIFMAKAGKKTLLIDADLRRPTVGKIFHLPPGTIGLSNAILTYANLQFATSTLPIWQLSTLPSIRTVDPAKFSLNSYVHAVDIPNLMIMPAGPLPPNPAELLDSKAMEHFLTALAGSGVEVIIFDTPPLLGLSDANILAPKVDGVLMVVDITNANKKNLKRAKAHLAQSESRVLGCVVNKQRQSRGDSAYSYYYYYTFEEEDQSKGLYYPKKEDQSKSMQNGHNPGVLTTQGLPRPQSQR
jgi:non-specific protein-tyrosine kinase